MSWYNNTSTDFIDATQTFTGGSTTIINGGDGGGQGEIIDILELRRDYTENQYEEPNPSLSYNLYLKNTNLNGEIRFLTSEGVSNNDVSNDALTYNVKIGKDGKIYGYYTYNFLVSATFTSKWIDITESIVAAQTAGDNALFAATGAAGAAGAAQLTANTALTEAQAASAAAADAATATAASAAAINSLIEQFEAFKWTRKTLSETFEAIGQASLETLRNSIKTRADLAVAAMAAAARGKVRLEIGSISLSTFNLFSSIIGVYVGAGITGIGVAAVGYLFDYLKQEQRRNTMEQYLRLLEEDQKNNTNLGTTQDVLHLSGLQIVSSTNTGFTTAGKYEVDIINDAKLEIVISSGLTATITKVIGGGDGFSVAQTILVPKNNLGGGVGNLEILITSLITEKEFIENDLVRLGNEIFDDDNRLRRRRNIPNTSSFSGDGFNITITQITEPDLGEITNEPTISLKIDTSQFNYDASGNLQLTNYSQIAQNQTDIATNTADLSAIDTRTGNLETYTASLQTQINTANVNISQNATDIQNNATQISTNNTINQLGISTNAQSIITINNTLTTIQTDINNLQSSDTDVYKLLLNNNETYSTTTDHIVNIGFNKTEFSSVLFNLIMGAVKVNSGLNDIPFSITDFSRYYFGLYPSATRLNYDPVITLVKQDNSKYYNDTNWNNGGLTQFGAYYFTNISSGVVYDLNKRFEWYGNIRFRTLDSSGNNYILRTAYEFEEVVGTPSYAHDINKMAFYYRDGKFYFSHLCKYNLTYYAIRLNQEILGDTFLNPLVTFSNTTPVYGNSAGYLELNVTGSGFNEQLYLSIKESFYSVSQATIEGLINTSPNSNPLFCGMVQSDLLTTHDPFGIFRLEYPQYTSGNLFKIARLEIEYQIMRNDGYYDGSGNWVSTGWIPAIPQTQQDLNNMYEELVIEFYQSYSDTSPSLTTLIDTRQFYTTTTNTIIIDFDLSPDLYTYTYEKWIIKPRFTAQFSSGYPSFGVAGYHLVPNQRSAFIHKVKMFRYIQKTIGREQVEEFSDGVNHTLSTFNYNKMTLHIGLNRNTAPFQDIWYKLNDNLDINKYTITIPQTFNTTNLSDITDLPPNVLSLPVDSIDLTEPFFISQGQPTITESNHILIIGDENLSNRLYITHYGWRFLLPTESNISETDLDNFDYLKNYNYYHRTAVCDRFFSCKEFYADVIDFKRLLIDGNLSYDEMTTSEFGTLSANSDGNNIKSLASVNIQNLYGLTASGYLYFDTTNGFSTNAGSGGSSYWTQLNPVTIYYPNTIECDRVNATTLVLSGVASSITFGDGTFLETASGLNAYTDADVINVLSQSASPSISWDATNNFFVVNPTILSDITNNNTAITTNSGNIATIFNDISFTDPSYLILGKNIQLPNGDVISSVYNDTNVLSVLQNSAGTNLVWNGTTNKIDLDTNLSIGSSFTYNNGTGTLSVTKFSGNGSQLTQLDAGNINTGTLPVIRGGTGNTSYFTTGGLLIGNPSGNPYLISQHSGLTYSVSTGVLKVNTIEFADQTQISTSPITYTDADVRNVLSQSASSTISWDTNNNYFVVNPTILSDITNNANAITTNTADLTTIFNDISFTDPSYLILNKNIQLPNGDTINSAYNDTNVLSVLQNSAGDNLVWNATTNKIDLDTDLSIGSSFTYNNGTGTLSVSKFSGNGASLTQLDAGNISTGTLPVLRGGTGNTSYFTTGGLLIGNPSGNPYLISQDADLTYNVTTGVLKVNTIEFQDQTQINNNKLYLCKVKYLGLFNLVSNDTWVFKQNQFNANFLINEGGFTLDPDGIVIPISGYYEIHIVNYFRNITGDIGCMISALAINGVRSDEDYICGSYIAFDEGLIGSRGNAGTIVKYLNQGDKVATAFLETGNSTYMTLGGDGTSFTLKRIG